MKIRFLALPLLIGFGLSTPFAVAKDTAATPVSVYVAKVDPDAFPLRPLEEKKLGATVSPATVRMITPGVDKFSIYRLIGPPHFNEGITRRWNYVLFFPIAPGSIERMRCRMEIRFKRPPGRYGVTVSEVIWQNQACADRVAAAR
jgi:hypothetical protein